MTCRRFSENLLDAKFYAKECHNCVYNTSSNQLLFGDYRKFTCVNPDCYKKKQIKFSQTKVRNFSPYYLFPLKEKYYYSKYRNYHQSNEFPKFQIRIKKRKKNYIVCR